MDDAGEASGTTLGEARAEGARGRASSKKPAVVAAAEASARSRRRIAAPTPFVRRAARESTAGSSSSEPRAPAAAGRLPTEADDVGRRSAGAADRPQRVVASVAARGN